MNIYFAASIRGGRALAGRYAELVHFLSQYGHVLTRHVADDDLLSEEKSMRDEEIFSRDMAWLKTSDLVIAEVTQPSIGVGYEIGAAVDMGLPVITLYNTTSAGTVSAMVSGNPGIQLICYRDMEDLREKLIPVLEKGGANTG
jgi:2'-deoxynucleoside 5'-phosphate N-hydrolase